MDTEGNSDTKTIHNNNDIKIEEENYPPSYYNYFLTGVVIH